MYILVSLVLEIEIQEGGPSPSIQTTTVIHSLVILQGHLLISLKKRRDGVHVCFERYYPLVYLVKINNC